MFNFISLFKYQVNYFEMNDIYSNFFWGKSILENEKIVANKTLVSKNNLNI